MSSQEDQNRNATTNWQPTEAQRRLALDHLNASPEFSQALRSAMQALPPHSQPTIDVRTTENESIVQWFMAEEGDTRALFTLVRRALTMTPAAVGQATHPAETVRAAAVSLYFLAACSLVMRTATRTRDAAPGRRAEVLYVPHTENIVCAVVIAGLLGGKLEFDTDHRTGLPVVPTVFSVSIVGVSDRPAEDLERAIFSEVFRYSQLKGVAAEGTGPLSTQEREDLIAELESRSEVWDLALGFVIRGFDDERTCRQFARSFGVPVLLGSSDVGHAILGMAPEKFIANVRQFWRDVERVPPPLPSDRTHFVAPRSSNQPPINSPAMNINNSGNGTVIVQSQSNSPGASQASTQSSTVQASGIELLEKLVTLITEIPQPDERTRLMADDAHAALEEASKPAGGDKSRVAKLIANIRTSADLVAGSAKIAEVAQKAFEVFPLLP